MYIGEDIKKQREARANNIVKGFSNSDDLLEKAHNHGDVHSNGKWYWESSANVGKGDWRTIKGASKAAASTAKPQPKAEEKKDDGKLTNEQKSKVTPLGNPKLYIELSKNSQEKKDLIALLKEVGTSESEQTTETGISGTYKVGNEYIKVMGTSVTTGLKKKTNKSQYLGMSGHKRWYGGGTFIKESDKSEKFTVFDESKMTYLIKRLNKKKK